MPNLNRRSIASRLWSSAAGDQTLPEHRTVQVLGSRIAYVESGSGPPVLFLHGGIASSRLWRRQMAGLSSKARCVAVDLIGTGNSDRLLPSSRASYRPEVQLAYLESFTQVLGLRQDLTLVLHGLGSMVGFALAKRLSDRVRGICHLESIFRPLQLEDLPSRPRQMFMRSREPGGERFVMDTDEYFDLATRREFLTPPGKAVIDEYRRNLGRPAEMRQALHTLLHSVPIDGQPVGSQALVADYAGWLRTSTIPKLLILGEPGYWLVDQIATEAAALPETTTVQVAGGHLLPEDSPDGVTVHLASWFRTL